MRNSTPSRFLFILVLFAFSVTGVSAATKTFTGGTGFAFDSAANWAGVTLPVAGNNLTIDGICKAYAALTLKTSTTSELFTVTGLLNLIP